MFKKNQLISLKDSSFKYAFIRANRDLTIKYHEKIKSTDDKEKFLKKIWFEEYNARLINIHDLEDNNWTHIYFEDENSKFMFLLKWVNNS